MPFPNPATQFKPGNPGGGRPKGSGILQRAARILGDAEGLEAEEIALKLVQRAKKGNLKAISMLLDRLDGPLVQRVEVEVRVVHEIIEAFSVVLHAELDDATATRILTRTIELAESKRAEDRRLLGGSVEGVATEAPSTTEQVQG